MITVRIMGKSQVRQVDIIEAKKILERTYGDPIGGLVLDADTREVLTDIGIDTKEIVIIEEMLGGG